MMKTPGTEGESPIKRKPPSLEPQKTSFFRLRKKDKQASAEKTKSWSERLGLKSFGSSASKLKLSDVKVTSARVKPSSPAHGIPQQAEVDAARKRGHPYNKTLSFAEELKLNAICAKVREVENRADPTHHHLDELYKHRIDHAEHREEAEAKLKEQEVGSSVIFREGDQYKMLHKNFEGEVKEVKFQKNITNINNNNEREIVYHHQTALLSDFKEKLTKHIKNKVLEAGNPNLKFVEEQPTRLQLKNAKPGTTFVWVGHLKQVEGGKVISEPTAVFITQSLGPNKKPIQTSAHKESYGDMIKSLDIPKD